MRDTTYWIVAMTVLVACSGSGASDGDDTSGAAAGSMAAPPGSVPPPVPAMSAQPSTGGASGGASMTMMQPATAAPSTAGQGAPTAGSAGSGTIAMNDPMTGAAGDDGGAAGSSDPGVMPGPDGFPKTDAVNVEQKGPYGFESYTDGLDDPMYGSAIMYYPKDAPPPYAAAVFSPGFTATKENYMNFLGELLATHGIAMLLTTPTTTGDLPQQRADDLKAAIKVVQRENTRDGSPLKGKLATDRVCVTGHSMGGGGTLWAAADLKDMIRCAVPLQPWQPGQSFAEITAPTMFIAAQSDTVATVSSNASLFYDSIPATVKKYYVEFAGASHFLTTNDLGMAYDGQSKYMIAFYKRYLEDDTRYDEILNAAADPELSQYKRPM